MNWFKYILLLLIIAMSIFAYKVKKIETGHILSHTVDLKKQKLRFYWKDSSGMSFNNFFNLKKEIEDKENKLIFAMNGGMYKKDFSPQGLYIENGKELSTIDTVQKAYGNFYMQPNGIFYVTYKNEGVVCKTTNFENSNIKYATQSGPMLLIEGGIHPKFMQGSKHLNIRNGVGILPNGNLLFAMSKDKINFYDFAKYFQSQNCKNALYLDGFVSKTYLPEEDWNGLGGTFGVIIAEIE